MRAGDYCVIVGGVVRHMDIRTLSFVSEGSVVAVFPARGEGGAAIIIVGARGARADGEGICVPDRIKGYLGRLGTRRSRAGRVLKGRCGSCGLILTVAFNVPVNTDRIHAGVGRVVGGRKLPSIMFRDLHRASIACGLGLDNNSVGTIRNSSNRTRTSVMARMCKRVLSRSRGGGTRLVRGTFCGGRGLGPSVRKTSNVRGGGGGGVVDIPRKMSTSVLVGILKGPRVTTLLADLTGSVGK